MREIINQSIDGIALQYNVDEQFVRHYVYVSLIVIFALVCGVVFKKLIVPLIKRIILKTSFKFDDYLFSDSTFKTFSHLIPAFIIVVLLPICYIGKETTSLIYIVFYRAINIYIIILVAHLIGEVLTNIVRFSKSDYSDVNNHYLEAIVQFIKIVIFFFAGVVIVSVAINRNPTTLLAGLGAMATVLLLVFQDTILGLVAGVQLNINKMLQVGDWIEIKSKGINGYVTKVNLTTIKIQNFDNSVSTIPPYKLVSETFQNWKGIEQCGGRQARRTLNVDMNTVGFVSEEGYKLLVENNLIANDKPFDAKQRVTNVTLYRRHIESFLRNHKDVDSNRWLMVRQLESTAYGMALEMYFYVSETDFVKYEEIVAEIYEYCIALAPTFNIKIYQNITDIKQLNHK